MLQYELFAVQDGFGYRILSDGNTIIQQDYAPDKPGFVVMTFEEASSEAQTVLARIEG